MIEWSRGLRIIVNPDESRRTRSDESVADYARRNGWLVLRIRDVPGRPSRRIVQAVRRRAQQSHDVP